VDKNINAFFLFQVYQDLLTFRNLRLPNKIRKRIEVEKGVREIVGCGDQFRLQQVSI
jgi:hypothetical protein